MDQGPPRDRTPQELWAAMAKAPRPRTLVDNPRKGEDGAPIGSIAIEVLTVRALMSAQSAAEEYAQKLLVRAPKYQADGLGYAGIFNNAMTCEILARACKSPTAPILFFGPDEQQAVANVRAWFSPSEAAVLFNAYCDLQHTSGPLMNAMTDDDVEAWVDVLGEGARRDPLHALSSEQKNDLVMRLVSLLRMSRTVTSSAGSRPDESEKSSDLAAADVPPEAVEVDAPVAPTHP